MKRTLLLQDRHSYTRSPCQGNCAKHTSCVVDDWLLKRPFLSFNKQQFTWVASDFSSSPPDCFQPLITVLSSRWSCGAERRSASKKRLKKSLSQELSAITSCVMWPIGRRFTSKPRWLEKRYGGISILAHSEPLFLCDASVLCMYFGSELLSHLVYRLHFIWNVWVWAGNIADSSGATRLYRVTKANGNTSSGAGLFFIVALFNLRLEMLQYWWTMQL